MILIKNQEQISNIKVAGNILAHIFVELEDYLQDGMTTLEIDRYIHTLIIREGAKPAFLGYNGFPASSCISINEEVIHGIPSQEKTISTGDLVSIDIGVSYQNGIADSAHTYYLGPTPPPQIQTLLEVTQQALTQGIKAVKPNNRILDISKAVQDTATPHSVGIIKTYCGHGVGTQLHEEPEIPNYYPNRGKNSRLRPNMVIAIEPMFTLGTHEVILDSDEFTVITEDHSLSAHFEHTVLVTEEGYSILT